MWEKFIGYISDNLASICLFLILGALFLFLSIAFVISEVKERRYRLKMTDMKNAVAIYILDIAHNQVTMFQSSDLSDVSSFPLGAFYSQFNRDEQGKVSDWINSLIEKDSEAPDFLETDPQNDSQTSRKQYYYLLQVDHVEEKKQLVHLQRHKIRYMVPKNSPAGFKGLSSSKEVLEALNKCKQRGFTACFRFQYRKLADKDKPIEALIFGYIKRILYGLSEGRRYLLEASGNELLVIDLKNSAKANAMYFIKSALNAINRYLSLKGYLSKIDSRVGLVGHQYFSEGVPSDDPDGKAGGEAILDYAMKTAQIAFEDEKTILVYDKRRRSFNPLRDMAYRTEVERIISDKRLKYEFRPVYGVKKGKVIGYLTKATPVDTYFDSLEELKEYAMRTDDLGHLFSTIARNTMPLFVNQRSDESQALFFPVKTIERPYMLTTFAKMPKAKNSHIVFLFNEADVKATFDPSHPQQVNDDMNAIRAKGYHVALELNDGELGLPTSVYDAYDFFVCDFNFAGAARGMDALVRSQLHVMVEKLLHYNKPIIANDIDGWPSVELLVRSGLSYISAECFAPYSEMIQPISSKSSKRIADYLIK